MPSTCKNIAALVGVIVAAACLQACGKISTTDPAETVVASLPQAAMTNYAENCSACHGAVIFLKAVDIISSLPCWLQNQIALAWTTSA